MGYKREERQKRLYIYFIVRKNILIINYMIYLLKMYLFLLYKLIIYYF